MADQADVYVKNQSVQGINVHRMTQDAPNDQEATLATDEQHQLLLAGPENAVVIQAPTEHKYSLCVTSDIDLSVLFSLDDSCWTINIPPNDSSPNTPTTVNVTLGDDEPD